MTSAAVACSGAVQMSSRWDSSEHPGLVQSDVVVQDDEGRRGMQLQMRWQWRAARMAGIGVYRCSEHCVLLAEPLGSCAGRLERAKANVEGACGGGAGWGVPLIR